MRIFSQPVIPGLCLLATVLLIAGCDLSTNQMKMDRSGNREVQDYRDALAPRLPEPTKDVAANTDPGIPDLQPYVAQPSENLKPMPLVSISVNQTVPIRDALFELAQQAGYDIELDPRITGSIIFTARDRPFDLVIRRISEIAGLRYKFEEDTLRVELDTPYQKTYKIDYLSYIRKNTGSITNNVSVASSTGGSSNAGPQGGSTFEASTESESNFWGELEGNLQQILGVEATKGTLKTATDPQITAAEQNPAPVEPVVTKAEDGTTKVEVQPPQATLQVTSLPPVDPNAAGGAQQDNGEPKASFSLNRQAGMISVNATERQHEEIKKYLHELRRSVTSQVLVEAKVLEVSLSDEYSAGIDWSALNLFGKDAGISFEVESPVNPALNPTLSPAAQLRAFYTGGDIVAAVEAISRFGTVHALASPRLTVLNNQSAVLNVARNQVYFEIDVDVTTEEGVTQTDLNSDIRNVPEGVLINVQPSIDLDSRTISMAVRPTVTRIEEFIDDPAIQFVTAQAGIDGVASPVPVVNVQEMDSVVRLSSGQAIVMGGLMQDRTASTQTGIPILSEAPIFGSLFRTQVDKVSKTELVVFLKATIVNDTGTVDDTDRDLYKTFSDDRRPLKM